MTPPTGDAGDATRSNLTVNRMLELTVPPGISIPNWKGILENRWSVREVWVDKWAGGSNAWRTFIGTAEAVAPPSHTESVAEVRFLEPQQVLPPGVPVDRAEFKRMVYRHLKPKSNGISPRALALELAKVGPDDGTEVFVSAKVLAVKVGGSRPRVHEARADLARAGWLLEDGRRGRAVVYHLAVPLHLASGEARSAAA